MYSAVSFSQGSGLELAAGKRELNDWTGAMAHLTLVHLAALNIIGPLRCAAGIGQVGRRRAAATNAALSQKLGVHRTRAIVAEAIGECLLQMIEAEAARAAVVGAIEKWTVSSVVCHMHCPSMSDSMHIGNRAD